MKFSKSSGKSLSVFHVQQLKKYDTLFLLRLKNQSFLE